MNRILFLLKRRPGRHIENPFEKRMKQCGIDVVFAEPQEFCNMNIDINTLPITDDVDTYLLLLRSAIASLVLIYDEADAGKFRNAEYFVMDVWEAEEEYFDKIYRRIHNLPWEIMRTERLIIRETVEDDVDILYEMYKNPQMTRYTEGLYDIEHEKAYITEYRKKVYACQGFGIWTLIDVSSRQIIGRAGLSSREGFEGVEAGFVIGCDYQNKGYATEAVTGLLRFAADENLFPVNALVMAGNVPSKKVLSKTGFSYIKTVSVEGKSYEMWQNTDKNSIFTQFSERVKK